MMMNSKLFYGEKVKLTAPREEDVDILVKWGDDEEYLRNVDTDMALPKTRDQWAKEGSTDSNAVYFRLRTIDNDELIGFAAIYGIEWNNRTGVLSIGIGQSVHRSKGYGSDAIKLILRYAFHELNLDRVGLDVIEYNTGAIKAYEKAGFQLEGRKRSMVYRDGKRYDLILMGLLRDEWEATQR